MNVPGTPFGNWRWRVKRSELKPQVARRMRKLVDLYERGDFREERK